MIIQLYKILFSGIYELAPDFQHLLIDKNTKADIIDEPIKTKKAQFCEKFPVTYKASGKETGMI